MADEMKQDDDSISPRLSADLSGLYRQKMVFGADFDAKVLKAARKEIGRLRRRRMWLPWTAAGLAAAAAVIAVAIWRPGNVSRPPLMPPQFALGAAPRPGENVNILAAYRLAKALHDGVRPTAQWDVNGDGKVDQHDVDALAAEAVKIDGGGAQ